MRSSGMFRFQEVISNNTAKRLTFMLSGNIVPGQHAKLLSLTKADFVSARVVELYFVITLRPQASYLRVPKLISDMALTAEPLKTPTPQNLRQKVTLG